MNHLTDNSEILKSIDARGQKPTDDSNAARCPKRESGGYQCELPAGHRGRCWISEQTVVNALGWPLPEPTSRVPAE